MSECVFWHFWINQWEPSMGGHWPIRGWNSGTSSCPEMWCVWFSIRRDVSDVGKQSVSELSCMDTWKILMKICQHCQRLPMFRIISDYFWGSHSNCKDILNKMEACSLYWKWSIIIFSKTIDNLHILNGTIPKSEEASIALCLILPMTFHLI